VFATLNSNQPFAGGPLNNQELTNAAIELVKAFAEHAGGIAADAWLSLPAAVEKLDADQSLRLMRRANNFLERGARRRFMF
jgi:hypothetical protein